MIDAFLYRFNKPVMLTIAFVVCISGFAQDLKKDYAEAFNQISKSATVLYDFNVSVYASKDQIMKKENIHFEKCVSGIYYSTNEIEFYLNNTVSVMVYKQSRKILWSHVDPAEYEKISVPENLMLSDSLFKNVDSVKYEGVVNNVKLYNVYYTDQAINRVSIAFDSKSNMIKYIVYFYSTESSSAVYCSRIDVVNLTCSNEKKNISKTAANFVVADGKAMKPALAYKGYTMVEISEKLYIK